MKNLLALTLLSLLISFTACKKPPLPIKKDIEKGEDGGGKEEKSDFIGSWSYTKIAMTNGTVQVGGNDFGTFDGTGKDMIGFVQIKEDQTFAAELEYTAVLDLVIFNQTQQQEVPIEKRTITGTWSESNGAISLVASDGTAMNVSSSTANRIVFSGTFTQQIPLGQQFNLDAESDVEFTIEK